MHASIDKASTHGMLIFGAEKIYASHLPLFHAPHNYQIILELELDDKTKQQFITDQQQHPEFTAYTIEPERFVLPDKINNKGSFKARLYRGHFERGGTKIADSAFIKIAAVIYFTKFNSAEARSATTDFILFGNSKEQFAVHRITNKPDFEQIIRAKTKQELQTGNRLFAMMTFNKTGNSPVGISGNVIETGNAGNNQNIVLLKQLYLEFDDLKD
jgi:hypothetical protein